MKLQKLLMLAVFGTVFTQNLAASELSLGTAEVNLTPHFVHSTISLDKSESIWVNVSSAADLDVGESMACEDHFSFELKDAVIDQNGKVSVAINGEESVIGVVKGRFNKRVKLNDNVVISHKDGVDQEGNKTLDISLNLI